MHSSILLLQRDFDSVDTSSRIPAATVVEGTLDGPSPIFSPLPTKAQASSAGRPVLLASGLCWEQSWVKFLVMCVGSDAVDHTTQELNYLQYRAREDETSTSITGTTFIYFAYPFSASLTPEGNECDA